MTLQEALTEAGVDIEHTLKRFAGNAALLERFVRKLPSDPSFGEIETALKAGNMADAERAAHTLKGVAANLGFQALSDLSSRLMTLLRDGQMQEVPHALDAVRAEMTRVLSLIAAIG